MGLTMTDFDILIPDLQIAFYHRFREIEERYLGEALRTTVGKVNIALLDQELAQLVNASSLQKVASFGLRGELIFPVPHLIEANPYLLGYYRLLYGFSQKDFYHQGPFGRFRPCEEQGEISKKVSEQILPLCKSLIATGEMLVNGVDQISVTAIHSLQAITVGASFRGSYLNKKGQQAVKEMYDLIYDIVKPYTVRATSKLISIKNDSDRTVHIEFLNDPDIRIQGMLQSGAHPILAIEIKGGTDVSNVYNRLGESEKSHRTARSLGFAECWTVINARLDLAKARQKSPSSTRFFYLFHITNPATPESTIFRDQFCALVGIRTT